jgi:WD40 repeat protein
MSARYYCLLFVVTLPLVAGWAVSSEPAPDAKEKGADKAPPQHTDASGDPLPPGVVRLGSTRLFHPEANFLTFSPDDKLLASVDSSGGLCVWEVSSGKELQHFKTVPYRGWSGFWVPAAFSADGKLVALGCADQTVRVWETATGKELHKFAGLPGLMSQLTFHPHGRYLAAGGKGAVQVWDLSGKKAAESRGDFTGVHALAHSPDGKTLSAVAYHREGKENSFKMIFHRWDADSGKELTRRELGLLSYNGALAPDGSVFALPAVGGQAISLRDPATDEERCRIDLKAYGGGYPSLSADGKSLTATSHDGTVRVWGTAGGKLRHEFKGLSTRIERLALSTDARLMALTGRADGAIHLFDVAKGKELHAFGGHRGGRLTVAFAPDGKTVLTVSRDGGRMQPVSAWADWSLRQWDPVSGTELRVMAENLGGEVHWTCFSDDGRLLATVTHDATLRLWDTATGEELRRWKVPTREQTINRDKYHSENIWHPSFAPDGKSLLAASQAKIHRWNVGTGEELPALNIPDGEELSTVRPGPDGRTLLGFTGIRSPTRMQLLDATSGRLIRTVGTAHGTLVAHAFSPDGRTLAVVDQTPAAETGVGVALWEVASGRERGLLKDTGWAGALAFSPDGKLLAVGGQDVVRLYLPASGREIARVDAYQGRVDSLAFSPDGKWLAVGGSANTALVCDVAALTAGKIPEAAQPTAKELDSLWGDLNGADGAKAYRAVTRLAAAGKESTPFLKERFKAEPAPDERRIARLIADLDDPSFEVREEATAALARLGKKAEAALTRALEKTESTEVRVRAKRLLEKINDPLSPLPSEELVKLRMLEVLTKSGTPEARDLLKELAKGDPEARLTQEAKAALDRLAQRRPGKP